jgi:hypothetical protein
MPKGNTLAAKINREHEQAEAAVAAGTAHAIKAGNLLLKAKAKVGHGAWAKWRRENLSFSARTAQVYMQLAQLDPQKRNAVAHLALRRAVQNMQSEKRVEEERARQARLVVNTGPMSPCSERTDWPPPPPPSPQTPDDIADDLIDQLIVAASECEVPMETVLAALLRRMPPANVARTCKSLESGRDLEYRSSLARSGMER